MLQDNEILVKDMEFKNIEDKKLYKIIKDYGIQYNKEKRKKNIVIIIETIIFIALLIMDFLNINVSLLILLVGIVMFIQYVKWIFTRIGRVNQHYDTKIFIKEIDREFRYSKVYCDDIAKNNADSYVSFISTEKGLDVMEKIVVPYVDKVPLNFDRKKQEEKPVLYLVKSGVIYFAVESLEPDWWSENIQKILK